MAMVKCKECGDEISSRAANCPKCGVPSGPARSGATLFSSKRTAYLAGALAVLLGGVAAWYRFALPQDERDAVNRISSAVGIPVTPWIDRAQAAISATLAKPQQQDILAHAIVGSLHPTGKSPQIARSEVGAIGEILAVRLTVTWAGGFLGTPYETVVTWKCSRTQNLGVELIEDNGPFGVDASNLRTLDMWFQTQLFPVLLSNAD